MIKRQFSSFKKIPRWIKERFHSAQSRRAEEEEKDTHGRSVGAGALRTSDIRSAEELRAKPPEGSSLPRAHLPQNDQQGAESAVVRGG